jgi:hypothetical protein
MNAVKGDEYGGKMGLFEPSQDPVLNRRKLPEASFPGLKWI